MVFQWFLIFSLIEHAYAKPTDTSVPLFETKNTHADVYENIYFGVSMKKPAEWYTMTLKELHLFIPNGTAAFKSHRVIPLFGFSAYRMGSRPGRTNANIIGFVERIAKRTTFHNDCDFFKDNENAFPKMFTLENMSECYPYEINGVKYARKDLKVKFLNVSTLEQIRFFRSTENGYLFAFTLTFGESDDMNQLMHAMYTIQFSNKSYIL
ncbi:unnamed protein product [Adineta ricciae]|uniref:Uncharacterized protein n=2 Tax=Adineta ricciae TaxID=249248 RepID=A0A815SKE6_ADIRI|nr:unnamed protein product [Adineta ricciae]